MGIGGIIGIGESGGSWGSGDFNIFHLTEPGCICLIEWLISVLWSALMLYKYSETSDQGTPQRHSKCPHIGGVPSSEGHLHVKWQNVPQESVP